MTAGSIDEESVKGTLPEVKLEIFVSEGKGRWYDVKDEGKWPRYEGFTEGMQRKIDAWEFEQGTFWLRRSSGPGGVAG